MWLFSQMAFWEKKIKELNIKPYQSRTFLKWSIKNFEWWIALVLKLINGSMYEDK